MTSMLRTVRATRYVSPLREGGSLPAIVEASDEGLYVVKFRGAGQGPRALIAELVAGEIGRALGLLIPEIVMIEVDPVLGRAEPDSEIQSLLKASGGLNLALDFLPGALPFGSGFAQSLLGVRHLLETVTSSTGISPRRSSGSTPSSPMWIARPAIPISCSGTAVSGLLTTAPHCTSITHGEITLLAPAAVSPR